MTDNPFTMQTMINPCRYDQIRAIWPQIWKTSTCDTVQKVNPIQMQSSIMKLLMLIFCSSWVRVPVTQPEGNFWRCNLWWWCCVHLMNIFFMSIALSQGYNHWDRLFLPLIHSIRTWDRRMGTMASSHFRITNNACFCSFLNTLLWNSSLCVCVHISLLPQVSLVIDKTNQYPKHTHI